MCHLSSKSVLNHRKADCRNDNNNATESPSRISTKYNSSLFLTMPFAVYISIVMEIVENGFD